MLTSGTLISLVRSLDKFETVIMVVIMKNDKERLKFPSETIADNLIDPDEVLVTEGRG